MSAHCGCFQKSINKIDIHVGNRNIFFHFRFEDFSNEAKIKYS